MNSAVVGGRRHGDGTCCPSDAATDSAGATALRSVPKLLRFKLLILPEPELVAREEAAGRLAAVSVTGTPMTSLVNILHAALC